MSDIETAVLRLALFALAFLAVAVAVARFRRPRAERAVPRMPRTPRRSAPVEEVEVAPSRLARVSARPAAERVSDPVAEPPAVTGTGPVAAPEAAVPPPAEPPIPVPEAPMAPAPDIEAPAQSTAPEVVRLVPRIAEQGVLPARSRLGGRPRVSPATEWPRIDGRDGDFLAQIACADLPATLWEGLGPRTGSILLFANRDSGAPMALHVEEEDGPPRDAPHAAGVLWSEPDGELAAFARRAFPEWPVDIVPAAPEPPVEAGPELSPGYDLADPALHPFDWDSILALAAVLESRLDRLSNAAITPADANDELVEALAEAAETNREARLRAAEIIAIIRDSADEAAPFSADDAAAVMAGLRAIRWTSVTAVPDPETGEDRVETLTLPLTRHHPGADLWVEDYRRLLIDHAKHVWSADADHLSPAARALFDPLWRDMAAREAAASMGGRPGGLLPGFDDERDVLLFVLPASALMNRARPGAHDMIVAIRKADLAIGDFSRLRLLGD